MNVLTTAKIVAFGEWLKAHRAEVATMKSAEVADAATKSLGFEITTNNVYKFCKELDISLSHKRIRFGDPGKPSKRDAGMSRQIRFLASQVRNLLIVVDQLHASLGNEFPRDRFNMHGLDVLRGVERHHQNGQQETPQQ